MPSSVEAIMEGVSWNESIDGGLLVDIDGGKALLLGR
eukprot:COSAG01_NODE_68_length_28978_cov_182.027777_23_plen_37_part_00